jgi:hypothetical protein
MGRLGFVGGHEVMKLDTTVKAWLRSRGVYNLERQSWIASLNTEITSNGPLHALPCPRAESSQAEWRDSVESIVAAARRFSFDSAIVTSELGTEEV